MEARSVLAGWLVCSMTGGNDAVPPAVPAIKAEGGNISLTVPVGDVIFNLQGTVCTASHVCGDTARISTLQTLVATQSTAVAALQTLVAAQSTAMAAQTTALVSQSTRIDQLETAVLARADRTDAEFARLIAHDLSLCNASCLAGVCANYSDSSGHGVRCVCNPEWSGVFCDVPDEAPTQAPTPRQPSMAPSRSPSAPCSATFGNRTWLPEVLATRHSRPYYFVRVASIASNELHKSSEANSNKISDAAINDLRAAGTGIMYLRCGNAAAFIDDEGTAFAVDATGARAMTRCAHHYWGTYVTLPNVGDAAHGIDCWESRGGVGQQGQVIYAHARQDGLGGCINIYGQGNTGALYVECPPESECTGPLC